METIKKYNWGKVLFFLLVFLGLFIFFTKIHMLVPYDGDDWADLSNMRIALPKWHAWNPSKVLPEKLYPFAGYMAAYVVTPVIKDYVAAITGVGACLYSALITAYMYLFGKVVKRNYALPWYQIAAVILVLLMSQFWIFHAGSGTSLYLLGSINMECIYHYSIPAVLNLCVVLFLWGYGINGHFPLELGLGKCSLLVLAIYLAIFSNVENSIVLASFLGAFLLYRVGKSVLHIREWKTLIRENSFILIILVVWLISLIFEMSGGRAHSIGYSMLDLPLKQTLLIFWNSVGQLNLLFFAFGIVILVLAIAGYLKKGRKLDDEQAKYFKESLFVTVTAFIISLIYLTLVCAKAGPEYLGRSDVLIGIYSWLLIGEGFALSYILHLWPKSFLVAPIALLVIAGEISNGKSTYAEMTMGHVNPKAAYAIDWDLIHQIQAADQEGKTEMVLRVPKGDNNDNWPHPMYMGKNISRTLYHHGMISHDMEITIQPDPAMNEEYHIAIPK